MPSAPRPFAFVIAAGLALAAAGCGSNNAGKIVGKWRLDSGGGMTDEVVKKLAEAAGYPFFEFKDDGTLTMGIGSTDPKTQKLLDEMGPLNLGSCKYKLGRGDAVELYDLSKSMRDADGGSPFGKSDPTGGTVRIDGDTMTLVANEKKDEPLTFTRLK